MGTRELADLGVDPDPRFTFANERTFLAWNRTSLALITAGLAVAQFATFGGHAGRMAIALGLIVTAGVVSFASYARWLANERSLRLGRGLGYSPSLRLLSIAFGLIAVIAAVLVVVDTP